MRAGCIVYLNLMGNCAGSSRPRPGPAGRLPALLPQEALAECLACGICASPYDCSARPPVMLCLNQHNACRPCALLLAALPVPACPFCRLPLTPKTLAANRILMEILAGREEEGGNLESTKGVVESAEERVLREARAHGLQRVIYLIEVGADLASVRELHLWSLSLTAIVDLGIFTGLKTLDLHKNCLTEIKNLEKLTQLAFLNLGYNQITVIENLQALEKLQFLDLCHNSIAKIDNLSSLKALHTLNLSHNRIQIVENLYQLPKLTILYLKNNPISAERNCGSMKALAHRGVLLEVSTTPTQE